MLTQYELDNHISLTSNQDVENICKPQFDELGLGFEYFTFHRIYDDATVIRLSNHPDFTLQYITQNYFSLFEQDHYPCTLQAYENFYWDDYLKDKYVDPQSATFIQNAMISFSVFHGFTVLRRNQNYFDSFNFGYRHLKTDINSTHYSRKMADIDKFCNYFVERAFTIISQARLSPFQTHYSKKYDEFLNLEKTGSFEISINNKLTLNLDCHLTPMEKYCLSALIKKLTAKEIAKSLNDTLDKDISNRTIESHLANIRKKTGLKRKQLMTLDFLR